MIGFSIVAVRTGIEMTRRCQARGTVASRVQMHGMLAGLESLHLQFYFHLLDALTGDPLLQLRRAFDQGIGATSQGGGGLDGFLRFGGDLKSHCRAKQ